MQTLRYKGEALLLLESAFLGVAGALSAQLFMWMLRLCDRLFLYRIAGYQAPGLKTTGTLSQHIGPHGLWLIPAASTLGGLLSGFLVYRFAPEAEGHGTDAAVHAFHHCSPLQFFDLRRPGDLSERVRAHRARPPRSNRFRRSRRPSSR